MKRTFTATCAAALLGGGILIAADSNSTDRNAQDPAKTSREVVQETRTTTDSGTTKTTMDTVYGKVETFDRNKSIKVSTPGKLSTSKSFDLTAKDETSNVGSEVKVGDWVKAEENTDNSGHKTLTVERWNAHESSR